MRVKGDLRSLKAAMPKEVEAYYREAIYVAQEQEAGSFELQATNSLCRLWQRLGRQAEARRLIARIYDWFSERFDAPT